MINPISLVKMVKKWQKEAAVGGRRLLTSRINVSPRSGHFVVYTTDRMRFVVPITFLNSPIFMELLRMSEVEFGLPRDRPITLPCDAVFMEYIVSMVGGCASKDIEKALLLSLADRQRLTPSFAHGPLTNPQILLQCF